MYRHGAVILKKKKLVSKGFNSLDNRPSLKFKYNYYSTHAESCAILKADEGDTLIVVRISKNGTLTASKPCSKCVKHARDNGIKKIYYSDWDSSIQEMKL
jgi:deoxycytidylate deaminase